MNKRDWDADDYARNSGAQQKWAEELIAKLALKGSESILDIGSGDGKISARLARLLRDGSILGIDASENMIRFASEHFPATTYPNLSFRHMDATRINFREKFDIAFSNAVLHWVEDHIAVLKGVGSCLKPGGRILFQMGGQGNAAEVFHVLQELMSKPQWKRYFKAFVAPYHFYGPKQYEDWLPQCGFSATRIELMPRDMQHRGPEGLIGWLRTTWFPFTDRLPEKLREPFLKQATDDYLAIYPVDRFGNTHVRMFRLEVEAHVV